MGTSKYLLIIASNFNETAPFCESDAEKFRDKMNQWDWQETTMLIGKKVNMQSVRSSLEYYSQKKGILVIAFFGHGLQVKDDNGDEEDGKDECWQMEDGMIKDDEITQIFNRGKCRIVFFSDSCHSGTIFDGIKKYWVSFTSSKDSQYSYQDAKGSIMTQHVLKYLTPGITYLKLHETVDKEVRESYIGELQCVQLRAYRPMLLKKRLFKF